MCYKASNTLCGTINMYHEYDANVKGQKSYIRFTFSPSRAISKLRRGAEVIIMIVPVPPYCHVSSEIFSYLECCKGGGFFFSGGSHQSLLHKLDPKDWPAG